MRKQFLVLIIAALSAVVGCKKEGENNPSAPGSAKLLKRIIETEGGVTTTHSLTYDGNKRLTSMQSSDNSETINFTYDNQGNVIKMEDKEEDVRNVFEFTYNNGLPVSGSFKSYENAGTPNETLSENYTLAYTVANGLVTKMKMTVPADPGNGQQGYELEYTLSYTNGNMTKVEAGGIAPFSASFVYGNKKPVYPAVFKYALDPAGYTSLFLAKNELLSVAYDFPGTEFDNTVTNQYTYDAQGYVLTANDGQTQTKFEYE